jgi:hypothetical protein
MEIRRSVRTQASFGGRREFVQTQQLDFSPITKGLGDIQQTVDVVRRERQSFELQKRLLEENNNLEADLETRRRDPNMDPFTFSVTVDSDYTNRANEVVEQFRKLGFDPDLVDDFALGMTRIRNNLTEKATTYQLSALNQRAVVETGKLLDEGTRQVVIDPDNYEKYVSFIEDTIRLNPDLTDEDRTRAINALRPTLSQAGAESLAMERPEFVISQLDPTGRWVSQREAKQAGSEKGTAVGEGPEAIREAAEELGVTPTELAAIANYESAGTMQPSIVGGAGGRYVGIFQFGPEEQRKYGVTRESSFSDQVKALVRFAKDRGYTPGMGWQKLYTTINAGNPGASVNVADVNGTQAEHYARIEREHFQKAREFLGINSDLVGGGERVPQPGDVISVALPQSEAGQDNNLSRTNLPEENEIVVKPESLHPVLRDLTGPERLKLLRLSYEKTQQSRSNAKAEMDLRLDIIRTQIDTNKGVVTEPIPTMEELLPIYGEVATPQIMAEIETLQKRATFMRDWQTSSVDEINREIEALRPAQTDPALPVKMKIFQEALQVRDRIIEERLKDPAAYALSVNPKLAEAVNAGDSFAYYKLQRTEQARLGIPPNQRNPWPKEYIAGEKANYERLSIRQRYDWMLRHMRGANAAEFANFAAEFEGSAAYDDILIANMMYNILPASKFERNLPLALQGMEAIRRDPARRPPAEKMLVEFQANLLGGIRSTNPNFSRSIQNAAAAIYVARNGDPAAPDPTLYRESLRQAVGGTFGDSSTGWGNYQKNGVQDLTIFPPGVTSRKFDDWLYSMTDEQLLSLSLNGQPQYATGEPIRARDIASEGVLVLLEPGVYVVKFQSKNGIDEVAYGADGNPLQLRIRAKDINSAPSIRKSSGLPEVKRNAF